MSKLKVSQREYAAIHKFIRDNYGKANKCEQCTAPAKRYDWALKAGCEYARNRDCFIELCRSCHIKYDFTEQRRRKISKSQIGINNNFYEKRFTEEMKEKQRQKKISKPIVSNNIETGEVRIFESICSASKQLGVHKSNIILYLKGKYNGTAFKKWQFTYC